MATVYSAKAKARLFGGKSIYQDRLFNRGQTPSAHPLKNPGSEHNAEGGSQTTAQRGDSEETHASHVVILAPEDAG